MRTDEAIARRSYEDQKLDARREERLLTYRCERIRSTIDQEAKQWRAPGVGEGLTPSDPGLTRLGLVQRTKWERPDLLRRNRTAEPAGLPPASRAVSVLDVEQPLLTSYDQKSGDGGEESDNGDDDPAHQAIAGDAHASADGLATSEAIQARRVFDGIVQPVDGREGRVPDADSVHAEDALSVEIWFSAPAVEGWK